MWAKIFELAVVPHFLPKLQSGHYFSAWQILMLLGYFCRTKFKKQSHTILINMNFIEELRWRNMFHQSTEGAEEHLNTGMRTGYIGFDPTAPALGIGNYVQIMILTLFQRSGHRPIVLMGGATGRVGDPSGKDKERELKTLDELDGNLDPTLVEHLHDEGRRNLSDIFFDLRCVRGRCDDATDRRLIGLPHPGPHRLLDELQIIGIRDEDAASGFSKTAFKFLNGR